MAISRTELIKGCINNAVQIIGIRALVRILRCSDYERLLRLAISSGGLFGILPEMRSLSGIDQGMSYRSSHSVLSHMVAAVKYARIPKGFDPGFFRLFCLTHDMGKIIRYQYHGYPGVRFVGRIMNQAGSPLEDVEIYKLLTRNHKTLGLILTGEAEYSGERVKFTKKNLISDKDEPQIRAGRRMRFAPFEIFIICKGRKDVLGALMEFTRADVMAIKPELWTDQKCNNGISKQEALDLIFQESVEAGTGLKEIKEDVWQNRDGGIYFLLHDSAADADMVVQLAHKDDHDQIIRIADNKTIATIFCRDPSHINWINDSGRIEHNLDWAPISPADTRNSNQRYPNAVEVVGRYYAKQ